MFAIDVAKVFVMIVAILIMFRVTCRFIMTRKETVSTIENDAHGTPLQDEVTEDMSSRCAINLCDGEPAYSGIIYRAKKNKVFRPICKRCQRNIWEGFFLKEESCEGEPGYIVFFVDSWDQIPDGGLPAD